MASTSLRASKSLPRSALEPSEREQDIIDIARATALHLPELFVAGRMFFRFDPGFRAELTAARAHCCGSPTPIPTEAMSDEELFDLMADLRNDQIVLEAACGLAARWGLDLDTMIGALAFDSPVNFPAGLLQRVTDPVSGLTYLELRVYSEYAWAPFRRVLADIPWLLPVRDLARFPDTPPKARKERGATRLRGPHAKVAARSMALHFLRRPSPGGRPTGGSRTWPDAAALWNRLVPEESLSDQFEVGQSRRRERHLLGLVYNRMISAEARLKAIRFARQLPRDEWLVLLGIDADTWHDIEVARPVSRTAWDSIGRALPEAADDLLAMARHGRLIKGVR